MPLADVERLVGDTAEAREYESALASVMAAGGREAEDEAAEAELEGLEREVVAAEAAALPAAPAHAVPAPERVPAAAPPVEDSRGREGGEREREGAILAA